MFRVGIGYDVHRLAEGRPLVLGGVTIPHSKGLDGHSDADVLIHAICDAVLGAMGESDIGHFFPNTDPRWKDAPSHVFLTEAARKLKLKGFALCNIDATIIAEAPKILPHARLMKTNIAQAMEVETDLIGIKATTNEAIGFIGRGEGIAAISTACIRLINAS